MQGTYWAEQRTFLPWTYKVRTALGCGYILQVSGRDPGRSHLMKLLHVTPWGTIRTVSRHPFTIHADGGQDEACALAVEILYGMTNDPARASGARIRNLAAYPAIARAAADLYGKTGSGGPDPGTGTEPKTGE